MNKILLKAHISVFILLYLLQTEAICEVNPLYN